MEKLGGIIIWLIVWLFFFLCCLLFLRLPVEREADVETFFRAGDFRFDSGLRFCNCCVDVVFSQAFLQKTHVQDSSFVAFRLESRFRKKIKVFFCQISRRQCCGEHFFSLIPLHIEKNKSVDIRQKFLYWFLIIHSDFQSNKLPVRVADFASLHVFAEWRQNIPKWAGNLSSLMVKTLYFDWPEHHVFVTCVDRYRQR